MKNKLAIFALSAIMALSGTVAIASTNKNVKAAEDIPYSEYFTYDDSVVTMQANKSAPSYYPTGLTDVNNNKIVDNVGMGITTTKDTTFTFNKPIYIGDNTIDVPLIEFMVTPRKPIEASSSSPSAEAKEFHKLYITLTDINDPSIYVEITAHFSDTNSAQTWLQVATPTHTRAGVNKDILTSEDSRKYGSGTGVQSSFTGGNDKFTTIYWQADELAFYAWKTYYASQLPNATINVIRDLDSPLHLNATDSYFGGFTSGYVNVSFKMEDVSKDDASIIIRSIDGQVLNFDGNDLVDTCGPGLQLDEKYVSNVPNGEVGRKYPYPTFAAYDIVDGNNVTLITEVIAPNGSKVLNNVFDTYFIPGESGAYTLNFKVVDKAGNESLVRTAKVEVSQVLDDFRLIFKNPSEIVHESSVGVNITVPSVQLVGGTGNNSLKTYFVYAETGEVVSTYEVYAPSKPGWYKIVYEYFDYLAGTNTFSIDIDVTLNSLPVFSEVSVPYAILSGKKYQIPNSIATDYASFNGEGKEVDCVAKIKINGYDKNNNPVVTDWITVTDGYYIPTIVSGVMSLKYEAYSYLDKDVKAESKIYEINVLNLSMQKDLYKFFNTTENIEAKTILVDGIEQQVAFYPKKTGESIQFINKLPESALNATINFDEKTSVINKFKVILQDSEYADEKVTLTYREGDLDYSYVTVCGQEYQTVASFFAREKESGGSLVNMPGQVLVKVRNGALFDLEGRVAVISSYDNGREFKGFTTGKIYFTVVFEEVDEDAMILGETSGVRFTQFFGTARFAKSGKDNVVPTITVNGDIATYYDINSYLTIPTAFAVDLIDPDVSVSLTITDPNGNVLIKNAETNVERILHLDKCGQYIIEYLSIDQMGNRSSLQIAVYSADTFDPIIEIAGQFKSKAKLGDKYTIHKAITYDNNDKAEDLVIYVYVFGPDGYIETVAHGKAKTDAVEYQFEKTGTYRIRYFVMDSYGNYTHKIFYVTVS